MVLTSDDPVVQRLLREAAGDPARLAVRQARADSFVDLLLRFGDEGDDEIRTFSGLVDPVGAPGSCHAMPLAA